MGGSIVTPISPNVEIKDKVITELQLDLYLEANPEDGSVPSTFDHLEAVSESISLGGHAGTTDYTYIDRSYGGAISYEAGGTTSSTDFTGNENTFIVDASSEFDFFGYSYESGFTDDSEVVVLEGTAFGAGTRSIDFGEVREILRTGML